MPYTQWEAHSGHDSCVQYFNYRIGTNYGKLQNYKMEIQRKSKRIVLTYCGFLLLLLLLLLLTFQGESYAGKIVYAYAALFLLLLLFTLGNSVGALITAIN